MMLFKLGEVTISKVIHTYTYIWIIVSRIKAFNIYTYIIYIQISLNSIFILPFSS